MKKRVIVLAHEALIPPENADKSQFKEDDFNPWETEYDIITTLKSSGHDVRVLGVYADLKIIRDCIDEFKPHIVFNLLEEFHGEVSFDQNIVSYLELLKVPYTGNNPRALILARDKALAKKILTYHRIKSAKFQVFPKNRKTKISKQLKYPIIVKCLNEEASLGIAKASIVNSPEKLLERVEYINKSIMVDAIAEEFIEGKEYYVGIYGNHKLKSLPVLELIFENSKDPDKEIYSNRAKFNGNYRRRMGIKTVPAKLDKELEERIIKQCKKTYKTLNLNGYARIDIRIDNDNNIFVLEANPNPNIAQADEFALSAKEIGIDYNTLIDKILKLGISWSKTS